MRDAEIFTNRLTNLRQDWHQQDTTGDKFIIEVDGQETNNRGIAGELDSSPREKLKKPVWRRCAHRSLCRVRSVSPSQLQQFRRSRGARQEQLRRASPTRPLGTIRSLEVTVQGFEERATKLEADIADAHKPGQELETKVGAAFEKEEHYQHLCRRQSEIEEQLDLTKTKPRARSK